MPVQASPKIERHKTAIRRNQISRPVRTAIRDGLLPREFSFFDYGCGHGEDVEYLKGLGFSAAGWDPVHYPVGTMVPADVVNLGYVINVIENDDERRETLQKAYSLAQKAIVISAQVGYFDVSRAEKFKDGYLSSRNTFQKYYTQDELGDYIRTALSVEPYPAGTGVYYVFTDPKLEQDYCRRLLNDDFVGDLVTTHQPLADETLRAIADLVNEFGRLPLAEEAPEHAPAIAILASAENWMRRLGPFLDEQRWDEIKSQRRKVTLESLSASNFALTGRQRMSDLSASERADIRSLFGSYSRAIEESDRLLDDTLRLEAIRDVLSDWHKGKRTREAVYVHTSMECNLPEQLSLLIKCARAAAQEELKSSEPTVLKFSLDELAVSFAYYPEFDRDPHPALEKVVRVDFETGLVVERSYKRDNPPILHRKELFVHADYPHYPMFKRLSHQEATAGLLGRTDIGTLRSWNALLEARGIAIQDHSLVGHQADLGTSDSEDEHPLWESEEEEAVESERRLRNARRRRRLAAARPRRFSEAELSQLGELVMRLGRLPMPSECPLPRKRYEVFVRTKRWRELLETWFREETFQETRRRLWESLILDLGTSLFQPGGRPPFKKWDEERQWSIKSIFGSFAKATTEADTWMRKMGDATYVELELLNCGLGKLHEEKGLYVATSLEERLPLVLRLLTATARLFATHAMPKEAHVVRLAREGDVVKFYEYEDFEGGQDSRRLETCKIMFRRRKVIASSFADVPRPRILTAEDKAHISSC